MNTQRIASHLFIFFSCFAATVQSATPSDEKKIINYSKPHVSGTYAYRDYHFQSRLPGNTNRFQGHSNLYMAGGNQFRINDSLSAGMFLYQIDSETNFQITPADNTNQRIQSYSIFAHVLKSYPSHLYLDASGGIGQSSIHYTTYTLAKQPPQTVGLAKSNSFDWFANLKALYTRPWRQFIITGAVGVLHGSVQQKEYHYFFNAPLPQTVIPSLNSQATLLLENLELGYALRPHIKPFVNGGLIQVLHYATSRPIVSPALMSTLPEITSQENGYQLGIGIDWIYKQFVVRLEQQHYVRGDVYTSNQSIATIKMVLG